MESSRRGFLAAGTAAAAAALAPRALADWEPSPRYPDPRVRILDPGFARYRLPLAKIERLATYVVEAGVSPRSILAFDVVDGGTHLANKRKLIDAGPGTPDGLRVDLDGNLWVGWGMGEEGLDGVSIFNPMGRPIGRIDLPERCANLCFGGVRRNRLFMCASTSLYSLYVNTQGAPGG